MAPMAALKRLITIVTMQTVYPPVLDPPFRVRRMVGLHPHHVCAQRRGLCKPVHLLVIALVCPEAYGVPVIGVVAPVLGPFSLSLGRSILLRFRVHPYLVPGNLYALSTFPGNHHSSSPTSSAAAASW